MHSPTIIELSRSAVQNNIEFIRKSICKDTRMSCILKGNAYGHGFGKYVELLLENQIDHFSVFSSFEAYQILSQMKGKRSFDLMIIGDIPDEHLEWVITHQVEFYVFDFYRLERALKVAKSLNKKAYIHLEVETGMNRLGFEQADWTEAIEFLQRHKKYLVFKGLCTHYAGAESIANHTRIGMQIKKFQKAQNLCQTLGYPPQMVHSACSAAAIRFPKTRQDLVRIGIIQYGFWPSEETFIRYITQRKNEQNPLQKVLSWRSRVMSLKEVKRGEYVGYGMSYLTSENKKLAVVGVGYSNGFARGLSNSGRVIIRGVRTQVIGTVNMNAITVDVTHIPDVQVGDDVILIGQSGQAEVSVSSFANFSEQLNYEVLARLPLDIERVVVD